MQDGVVSFKQEQGPLEKSQGAVSAQSLQWWRAIGATRAGRGHESIVWKLTAAVLAEDKNVLEVISVGLHICDHAAGRKEVRGDNPRCLLEVYMGLLPVVE